MTRDGPFAPESINFSLTVFVTFSGPARPIIEDQTGDGILCTAYWNSGLSALPYHYHYCIDINCTFPRPQRHHPSSLRPKSSLEMEPTMEEHLTSCIPSYLTLSLPYLTLPTYTLDFFAISCSPRNEHRISWP
jgi:hypothetical protein